MSVSKIIKSLYLFLFFTTPLIYVSANSELFELPKMIFIYLMAIIIVSLHLFNHFQNQTPIFKPHPLNLFLSLLLITQIISTFFSIDIHTSLMGYYSRLNGGLYSLITYYLLFQVLHVYIDEKLVQKIINISLISGFFVAAFGIAQHFGIDAHLWVQDVRSRVFSTLGQPNWLAAYLCLLLPFVFYRLLSSTKFTSYSVFSSLIFIFYLALLFTKSKSGIFAAITSLTVFTLLYLLNKTSTLNVKLKTISIPIIFLIILSLTIPNPIKDYLFPHQITPPDIKESTGVPLNITPSEDIRKIVWQGAIALWRQYPLFGTGPETFAYSYYWVRPVAHNLTSEWDFLYNKAHNEYLNYLATTGAFGLSTYLLLIFSFIFILIKNLFISKSDKLLNITVISSFLSILITNSVGFSTTTVSLYFFLLPALISPINPILPKNSRLPQKLKWPLIILIFIISLKIFTKTINFYISDLAYSQSLKLQDTSLLAAADQINISLNHFPHQATYLSQASSIYTNLALAYNQQEASSSASKYVALATQTSDQSVRLSPYNLNFWKIRAQNYYLLSTIDAKYFSDAIKSLAQVASLAPTDAKTFYTLARFFETIDDTENSIKFYQEAINLKPNYDYAYFNLAKIYFQQKKYDLAKHNFSQTLIYAPANTDAQKYLDEIEKTK